MDKNRIPKKRMITLGFRADTILIDLFYQECKVSKLTRSEAFRQIFNEYMINKYFKDQKDESGNSPIPGN